jgi:hypothetical protein
MGGSAADTPVLARLRDSQLSVTKTRPILSAFLRRNRIATRRCSRLPALRSTVVAAAKLTLEEGERPPTLRPWKPSPHAAVTPPMRPIDQTAPEQPGAFERTGESPAEAA